MLWAYGGRKGGYWDNRELTARIATQGIRTNRPTYPDCKSKRKTVARTHCELGWVWGVGKFGKHKHRTSNPKKQQIESNVEGKVFLGLYSNGDVGKGGSEGFGFLQREKKDSSGES